MIPIRKEGKKKSEQGVMLRKALGHRPYQNWACVLNAELSVKPNSCKAHRPTALVESG
jgi:hypothetical protein